MLVLDAGTGIRRLGATLGPEARRVDVLLTHLHMDHIQGLGFFRPLFEPDLEVHLWGPPSTTLDLRARLSRYLSPPLFPVRLRDLPCRLEPARRAPGGIRDRAVPTSPPRWYAIPVRPWATGSAADGATLAYIPDHEPALGPGGFPARPEWTSGFDLAAGADLLIHDAQYSAAEYADHVGWGHSAMTHTLAFATAAGVKRLVTFHHDPGHDDAALDAHDRRGARGRRLPVRAHAGHRGSVRSVLATLATLARRAISDGLERSGTTPRHRARRSRTAPRPLTRLWRGPL